MCRFENVVGDHHTQPPPLCQRNMRTCATSYAERKQRERTPLRTIMAQCAFAARWGSQSWLQPAFQPAGRDCASRAEPARKPVAGRIACPTIRRGTQRNEELVVQMVLS